MAMGKPWQEALEALAGRPGNQDFHREALELHSESIKTRFAAKGQEVVDKNLRPHSLQGFMEDVSMGALREDERGLLTAGQSDDEVWEAAAVAARAAVAHGMPSPAGRI